MCSSWLPAQQKLKIIWHHAFCCWLHPWNAMCPPFSNFHKTLAASSKDMQSGPKGQKKKTHLEGKLLLSSLQKKNPTKKQNREWILFPAKLVITYFCSSSSLATC
jgi:hypothetical protein